VQEFYWKPCNFINSLVQKTSVRTFSSKSITSAACSGVPRNFIWGGSTNSVEDRENGDLGAVAP
jgi:hypothetical protein